MKKKLMTSFAGVAPPAGILGGGLAMAPGAEAQDAGFDGGGIVHQDAGFGGGVTAPDKDECG